ncbi:MAG: Stp1/IreP family PP2C-type Ser/Thr phosphatase [Anaerolineae bacterium]|nr:Stp1/IreP family PP2C-type Ser/Thr phosphatase [Anaerolineae bacterium]
MRTALKSMDILPTMNSKNREDFCTQPVNAALSGGLFLPVLWYQSDLLNLILLVSIGFVALAVILGIFLFVMARRSQARKASKAGATEQMPIIDDDDIDDTLPGTPALDDDDKDDTEPSLPVITTVGEPNVLPISGERPSDITWEIASLTDVGLKRDLNEDNMLMIEAEDSNFGPYGIYVVADGLGGHVAGEVASQVTVDTIQQQHEQNPPSLGATAIEEWLRDTTTAANEAVLKHQDQNEEGKKMGSTIIMAFVTDHTAHIINVGDSRAYYVNHETVRQVSVDHSLVERLVQIGQITREEARTHKQRNVIYSTLGEKRKLEIGYYQIELNPGDRLLLCSDGLSEKLPDEEILKISHHQDDPALAIQMLVEAAKQAGGEDNITAMLIQMNG